MKKKNIYICIDIHITYKNKTTWGVISPLGTAVNSTSTNLGCYTQLSEYTVAWTVRVLPTLVVGKFTSWSAPLLARPSFELMESFPVTSPSLYILLRKIVCNIIVVYVRTALTKRELFAACAPLLQNPREFSFPLHHMPA